MLRVTETPVSCFRSALLPIDSLLVTVHGRLKLGSLELFFVEIEHTLLVTHHRHKVMLICIRDLHCIHLHFTYYTLYRLRWQNWLNYLRYTA